MDIITPWDIRSKTLPAKGHIRFLDAPNDQMLAMWNHDRTLTEWVEFLEKEPLAKPLYDANQRQRWLARIVVQRWVRRVWLKRTQCNVDMIDMKPIPDKEAIFLTDTRRRVIYRFHSRDVIANLLANIGMSEEMLPTPRYPTNPWTNESLRRSQTTSICEQLVRIYANKGKCPPVIFAAFCEARFNIRKFYDQNSSLLAQYAIYSFFKDLHPHNQTIVLDTIMALLVHAGLEFSMLSIRKWLGQTEKTALHREWMTLVRDYTLFINLRVQVREAWVSHDAIDVDVRELYSRTVLPSATSRRLQYMSAPSVDIIPPADMMYGILGLPMILHPSTEALTEEVVTNLLEQSFGFPTEQG